MKKFVPYCIASGVNLVLAIALSLLFNFSLSNTWQGLVSVLLVFGPFWIYGWKQADEHKDKYPFFSALGKWCLILFACGYLLVVLLYLARVI